MKQQSYDFLIVGAGLFGATVAHELTKKGFNCLVIDKRDHIAGNIYTENIEGINVHRYGAHIFHTSDKQIWDYVNQFAQFNNFVNSPMAIYKDNIYNLPFNMNTFAKIWNVKTPKEAKEKIEQETADVKNLQPKNLEEQAIKLVGKTIYQILVKGYTEKQWGRDCKELPPFIIKRLPVRFTYDNNYFTDIYQGIPIGGYTKIIEKMLEGVDIKLNTSFQDFLKTGIKYKKLIFTGAIDEYYNYCFGHLKYRSVYFKNEILDVENAQGNAVINYTERQIPYTRIIEHKHFEKTNSPKTVLSKEYPVEWTVDGKYEPYYPINDEENMCLLEKYNDLAKREKNVYFGGRLGEYKYYDMDKVIKRAFDLISKLTNSN